MAWTQTAVASITLSVAIGCTLVTTAQLLVILTSIPEPVLVQTIAQANLPILGLLFLAIIIFVRPLLLRGLGVRSKHWLPKSTRERFQLTSLAAERRLLRVVLVALAALPLQTNLAHSVMRRVPEIASSNLLAPILPTPWTILAVLALLWLGRKIHLGFPAKYMRCRYEALLRGLRHFQRGVALRSFIPQWDNPDREIYRSCRVSRRIAWAYRINLLVVAGCFSAAGCLAARLQLPWFLGEALTTACIAAVLAQWPTAVRMVAWCGLVVDPICGHPDDFDEYD